MKSFTQSAITMKVGHSTLSKTCLKPYFFALEARHVSAGSRLIHKASSLLSVRSSGLIEPSSRTSLMNSASSSVSGNKGLRNCRQASISSFAYLSSDSMLLVMFEFSTGMS